MKVTTDLHTHTTVSSHAYSTIRENAFAAHDNGIEAIAITNHAPGMPDSAHLWHFDCLRSLPRKIGGTVILRGAECSFQNENAELDLPENTLKKLDVLIASVHTPAYLPKSEKEHTSMLLKALDNPYIDILGHIDRVKCGVDFDAVAKKAKEKNVLIELNAHSLNYESASITLTLSKSLLKACMKYGTQIVLNTDSHYCENIGNFAQAYDLLNELNFDENLIANTTLEKYLAYMASKNKFVSGL